MKGKTVKDVTSIYVLRTAYGLPREALLMVNDRAGYRVNRSHAPFGSNLQF